jgi:TRAP-type C4-dicarboxylate transport system permease small subunit
MSDGGPTPRVAVGLGSRLRTLADWTACAMFAAVFLIFNYKIFTRYFEHDEAVWADEVLVILFVWIIFWANAFLVRDKQQISFDLVYRLLPDDTKRYVAPGLARLYPLPVARAYASAQFAA